MRNPFRVFPAVVLTFFVLTTQARAQTCPAGVVATPKSSSLYVFFPTAVDATFPSYLGEPTSPVNPFDMAEHDANLSTAAVRQRAFELMQTAYCEFDIDVKLVTTPQTPMEPRWQIVAFGSDSSGGTLVGLAQDVDTGDVDNQDYCRVWVENIGTFCGSELSGANSTLERWATALANLAAHETSHNYGAAHPESLPNAGEDAAPNHFIADPNFGATASTISDRLNHHSDAVYERFGHDVGLTISTLHNWDFVNPNSGDADSLTIRLLSQASTLTIGWFYNGSLSPWTSPTVTQQPGTVNFKGEVYNIFDLEFSTPKAWGGAANGIAPAGEKFHVGATFVEPDAVIVNETTLASGGSALSLKPRLFGYDAGTSGSGFDVNFFNTGSSEMFLSDVQVLFMPRMVDIEEMVVGGALRGVGGDPTTPFARQPLDRNDGITDSIRGPIRIGSDPFTMTIAKLTDRRHLDKVIKEGDCVPSKGRGFGDPSAVYCPTHGNVLSLFPATYTYVSATVTDPNAHYWDRAQQQFVDGPLSTRIFFQVAGTVPDANQNGRDDLIDIREGTSRDENENGIQDEAERERRGSATFTEASVSSDFTTTSCGFDGN